MKTIWKYPIPITDCFELEMPRGAVILTVQTQYDKPVLWVLVDEKLEASKIQRQFRLIGTGHIILAKETENYIGTFQINNGTLVYHLFELKE